MSRAFSDMTNEQLTLAVERLEVEAWVRLLGALPAELRARLGIEIVQDGSATSFLTPGSDVPTVNRTFGLGLEEELTPTRLERTAARYDSAGIRRWMLEWMPAALPRSAHELFIARGGRVATPMLKLCARTRQLDTGTPSSPLRVVEIGADEAQTFEATVATPLGVTPELSPMVRSTVGQEGWHHYVVLDDGRPIAGAAMYAHGAGAWFGLAATAITQRGRGAQRALLARRGSDASKLGCRWVCAETPPDTVDRPNPSYRNLRRAGLDTLYERAHYVFSMGSVNAPSREQGARL
jgi:hypothetical protein